MWLFLGILALGPAALLNPYGAAAEPHRAVQV
jgi:hypothetical protein